MGYFDKFSNEGVPFMEGAEKRDIRELVGKPIHIAEFGFIKGDNGEFGVFRVAEKEGAFYFAPSVITDILRTIRDDSMEDYLSKTESVIVSQESKKGREYFSIEFHEDEIPFE